MMVLTLKCVFFLHLRVANKLSMEEDQEEKRAISMVGMYKQNFQQQHGMQQHYT